MTTTAAQDEFNELMRDKDVDSRHPEDRHDDSDISEPESPNAADDYLEKVDTDDELELPVDMRSNYYMPSHIRSEANTGPKGVIADAQAFEQAKKAARRFTWKKSNADAFQANSASHWADKDAGSDSEEEGFMKEWRAARLRELQNVGQRIRSRTNSPSRRIYGGLPLVDAVGYLDAIEKTNSETTVVVFVYDDDVRSPSYLQQAHSLTYRSRKSPERSKHACAKWHSETIPHASSCCTIRTLSCKRRVYLPYWPTRAAKSSTCLSHCWMSYQRILSSALLL